MEDINMNEEKVFEIIAEQLGISREELSKDTSLSDDLGADSLDLFQIIMGLEEEFNIEIPTEDVEGIHTVSDVITYLSDKVEQ